MTFSSKLGTFQKKEGQIRNQWRQMYSSEHIHREYKTFFPMWDGPFKTLVRG